MDVVSAGINLFHNDSLLIHYFICMIFSLSDLDSMCKIQKNFLLSNEVRKTNYHIYI